jgi:hypothetical protein
MGRKFGTRTWVGGMLAGIAVLAIGVRAQNSAADSKGPSLGDLARQQRTQRQHAKPAKLKLSDDDLAPNQLRRITIVSNKSVPGPMLSGSFPGDPVEGERVAVISTSHGKSKIFASFWQSEPSAVCGADPLDCAELTFLPELAREPELGSAGKVLYDREDTIDGQPARVVDFTVKGKVEPMRGVAAFVIVPYNTLGAACIYPERDRLQAEGVCDAFLSSLKVSVPPKTIPWMHPRY